MVYFEKLIPKQGFGRPGYRSVNFELKRGLQAGEHEYSECMNIKGKVM